MDADPEPKPGPTGVEAWVEAVGQGSSGPQAGTTHRAAGGLFQVSPLGSCTRPGSLQGLRMFVCLPEHRGSRVSYLCEMRTADGQRGRGIPGAPVWGELCTEAEEANPTV